MTYDLPRNVLLDPQYDFRTVHDRMLIVWWPDRQKFLTTGSQIISRMLVGTTPKSEMFCVSLRTGFEYRVWSTVE